MGLLQALGLPERSSTGSPAGGSPTPRLQGPRFAEGLTPFLSNERPLAGPTAPGPGSLGEDPRADERAAPLDGKVISAPAPVGDEGIYRSNLKGIRAELDSVLGATPPDKPSADVQSRLRNVVVLMEDAARDGDFDQANLYADELPGLLNEYKRAVDAHAKRAKADQDAQAAFEARHEQMEWEISGAMDYKAPDADASAIQDEIIRQKTLMDLAVLQANFSAANVQLDAIASSLARFRDALKRHQQAMSQKWIEDAPKRAFEANFSGIKSRLEALAKLAGGSKQPFADQLKRIAASRAALQKLLSAKSPDYAAASRLVNDLKRLIAQYDLSVAARQKVANDAAEAKAKSTYLVDLRAVDASIRFLQDSRASGSAPFDKPAGEIFDRLLKARADYDSNQGRWNFQARQLAIDKLKALVEQFKAASSAFWQRAYKDTRASISDKDLKWALDPAWGDGAMKQEQQKVQQLRKDMEKAAADKAYYAATEKASILYHELWRLKTVIYAVPGANGGETAVRPQLLGQPLDAPSTYTLLRLLRKDGNGSIDESVGAKLNGDGEALLEKWQRMVDLRDHWSRDMTSLKKGESKIAAALGSVKQAAQAIAGGAGGPELRKVIEEYSAADDSVKEAAADLKTGFDAYTEAVKGYTAALTEQKLESAKRTKNLAKDKRDAEAAAIEGRKNVIRSAASLAASILKPTSWLSIPGALVSIGAMELGAWFSSHLSAGRLAQLEKELELATQEVTLIQDELGVVLVEKALARLQGTVSEQNTRRMKFENKLTALELVGARIVSTMKKSSALASGASALELRGAVEGAKRSSKLFIDGAETLDADMQSLAPRYASFASSFEDTAVKYRDSARATAEGNATTLYEASIYLKSLVSNVRGTQDYLHGVNDKASSHGLYRALPELRKAIIRQK
jgi:hypothetical protein